MVTNPFGAIEHGDEAASRVLRPGTRLGRYELLTRVGKGGMASVWAARQNGQRGFTKAVSVKTILPHLALEEEFETLFLREARIASTIRHPNVCEVYDLGEDAGTLYMAMEWINGDSLSALLHGSPSGGPISWPLAARITADACGGLHAAHNTRDAAGNHMGILHRDISPQNILVSQEGIVKVADFGIAKASMSLSAMTRSGFMRGKVAYSAPERLSGAGYDQRSDVYSLGCVLYELVTGRAPFVGDDDVKLLVDITSGSYRSIPSSLALPPALMTLIERALAAEPDERVQTADEFRVALETLLFERKRLVSADHVGGLVRTRLGANLTARQGAITATLERLSSLSSSVNPPSSSPAVASRTLVSVAPSYGPPPIAPSYGPPPIAPSYGPPAIAPSYGPPSGAAPPMPWATNPHPQAGAGLAVLTPSVPSLSSSVPSERRSSVAYVVCGLVLALAVGAGALGLHEKNRAHAASSRPLPAATAPPEPVGVSPVVAEQGPVAPLPPTVKDPNAGVKVAIKARRPPPPPPREAPDDPLELNLPPVPAEAPAVTTPSNPY